MAAMTTAPSTAMRGRRLFILLVLAVAAAMGRAEAADPRAEPEPATRAPGATDGGPAPARRHMMTPVMTPARRHMIAAANPLAARAGLEMLRSGGSAVDAAIAAQMVLSLVEPQSSGIGGGGFLVHHAGATGRTETYDGRETAPAGARADLFSGPDGKPLTFRTAAVGGRAVGVPGLLRMLEAAHRNHGRLPWARLFAPAIGLAETGFRISPRLAKLIAGDRNLRTFDATHAYFYDDWDAPRAAGSLLVNRGLAETLRAVAEKGADAFYQGPIARDIVAAVATNRPNPGRLSLADMAGYRAKKRPPVCLAYRAWRVCGMGPPSSGGITTLQTMGILASFDLAALKPVAGVPRLEAVHLIAEASRLAFADRNATIADPDFVALPDGLLQAGYLTRRAKQISPTRSMGKAKPGMVSVPLCPAPGDQPGGKSTTHLSVIDDAGNVVSMTTSIETVFGSRLMVRGFLLNNQLTDFAFRPMRDGVPNINRVEPGKRPRSSMAPTIVFDKDGRVVLAVGSPGGTRIIGYVAKTLIAVLDWGMDIQAAIDLPHFVNRNGTTHLEQGTGMVALKPHLEALGHEVRVRPMTSGLHGIMVSKDGLMGGADRRREGVAIGD